ncbi:MAG TPA: aminofutalosine synthase MqnE [Bacteroidia bacterium]|jgi:aminodeoxyfutalosine synthase|nr:aminofutalosine synthase MqnE [Bacteroidia bacterium]
MSLTSAEAIIESSHILPELKSIAAKVFAGKRISPAEGLLLYEKGELGFLGSLANHIRERKHGKKTFFNRNFHIEPTNICVFDCKFCSYSRLLKQKDGSWELSEQQMLDIVKKYEGKPVTEVHIVGGVHPKQGLMFFAGLLDKIRTMRPELHIKAFTPVEMDYMFRKAKVSVKEGLQILKDHGLGSMPGGGAEIFDEKVRAEICEDKCTSAEWLNIHETAHSLGIPSNATMLYGHIETFAHRIDHMERLRALQDRSKGFNTFIPLKFRNKDNQMSAVPESSVVEDLRNYAIARIYLDNFEHIKAYWPMIGRTTAQLALGYGVDDIDGTIDDTTKIYTMAGSEEKTPALSTEQLVELIRQTGRQPIERDTLYNVLKDYTHHNFALSSESASAAVN